MKDKKNKFLTVFGPIYYRGFDDCLDVVLSIMADSKGLDEARRRVEHTQILVKCKKAEELRRDLGVIGKSPF